MNQLIRFPCPKCKKGHISERCILDLLTYTYILSYDCYNCGYTLKEYINGKS